MDYGGSGWKPGMEYLFDILDQERAKVNELMTLGSLVGGVPWIQGARKCATCEPLSQD